ncbi:TetR/AcrR family transcriptional regulator [Pyruvatibacter sp.]|uniref:TetR/AcrR family transcriptional regulator n=1 Tax=Pyruvatibacter sp. TaxID=1981328 RepID=UPI0032648D0B
MANTSAARKSSPRQRKTAAPEADASIRAPQQARSRRRVDDILGATKDLIVEHGSAGLKIQDIAARAGITAGSIYQYFPNKGAIIEELGHQYFAAAGGLIVDHLNPKPGSMEEMEDRLRVIFEAYVDLHIADPVARDIFRAVAADKSLEELDRQDTLRNVKNAYAATKHLFAPEQAAEVRRRLWLSFQMSRAVVAMVIDAGPKERIALIRSAQDMLSGAINPS